MLVLGSADLPQDPGHDLGAARRPTRRGGRREPPRDLREELRPRLTEAEKAVGH